MKKIFSLILTIILLPSLVGINLVEARSYRTKSSDIYVHGYYRNGKYVQPYYRSAPDGNVFNNYSCIDDGKCGTNSIKFPTTTPSITPLKNTSTQNNNTTSNKTILPTTPSSKTTIPANASLDYLGNDWVCNKGYKRNYFTDTCDKIVVPVNGSLDYFGNDWACNKGYKRDYLEDTCDKIVVPTNGTIDYFGNDWVCNKGYIKNYFTDKCDKI